MRFGPFRPPHTPLARCLLLLLLALFTGCAGFPQHVKDAPSSPDAVSFLPRDLPAAAGQLLLLVGEGGTRARLYAVEREDGGWRRRLGPFPAAIGRRGFAKEGEKREGDGRTPTGLFPLEFVFGYAPRADTRMPYRQATEDDLWIDDPTSPDYNRWVRRGESAAASYEVMRLPDIRYRHGVVIGYNRSPVVQGMGSAIFLHAWLHEGGATAGCAALDEGDLVALVAWLDPAKHPMILMGDAADLAKGGAIAAGWNR